MSSLFLLLCLACYLHDLHKGCLRSVGHLFSFVFEERDMSHTCVVGNILIYSWKQMIMRRTYNNHYFIWARALPNTWRKQNDADRLWKEINRQMKKGKCMLVISHSLFCCFFHYLKKNIIWDCKYFFDITLASIQTSSVSESWLKLVSFMNT